MTQVLGLYTIMVDRVQSWSLIVNPVQSWSILIWILLYLKFPINWELHQVRFCACRSCSISKLLLPDPSKFCAIRWIDISIKHDPVSSYSIMFNPELFTGRMDPRFGSGHDFAGFGRVGSALRIFKFFTDYFLVPESIWIFEYCIRIDWFSTIFNI